MSRIKNKSSITFKKLISFFLSENKNTIKTLKTKNYFEKLSRNKHSLASSS